MALNSNYKVLFDKHTTTEIAALELEVGVIVFDTTLGKFKECDGTVWTIIPTGRRSQVTVTDDKTLTFDDADIEQNIATDAKVFTLPKITTARIGTSFFFRNTGADDAVALTLAPNASDSFSGTIANATADSVASDAVDKDFVNTKATANLGDYVEVRAIALTKWFIIGGVGIWASQG